MLKNKILSLTALIRTARADINTIVETGSVDAGTASKLTNHLRTVYSKEIEFKAMPIMMFVQFAKVKKELATQPGLTIQMMAYDNLKKGKTLKEGTRMKTQTMSSQLKSITVAEKGNAIAVTELALKASFTDIMADAVTLLSRDVALTLDCELRDTALTGTNVIYGRATSSTPKVADRKSITAANLMSVATIKDAVEILATNNTPKFEGSYYVCMVHPHVSRCLRDDTSWIDANKYASPENLLIGEIGKIENVRFVETTLMCNGAVADTDDAYVADLKKGASNSGGNLQVDVYQSVLFGEDYYGYAIGLPVELRDGGVQDFGREHGLAWYAIWGTGLLNPGRGVVIETA